MSLKERLNTDMKEAMRARETGKLKLSVIRMVRAAIKNLEIEKGRELNEEEFVEVLAREVKMRRESLKDYEKAERHDLLKTINSEIDILLEYLPSQMSEGEIISIVRKIVSEVGAQTPKDMGKVMSKLVPLTKGKADGKLVSEIVKKVLNGEM